MKELGNIFRFLAFSLVGALGLKKPRFKAGDCAYRIVAGEKYLIKITRLDDGIYHYRHYFEAYASWASRESHNTYAFIDATFTPTPNPVNLRLVPGGRA